ncbi:hypothetical protein sos41_06600 [Alphaproteobacteria bacterium SO-S41]|nr:hypothetical protein sos41_06600 [Alphaproteobacteria bacterium SO-S41]
MSSTFSAFRGLKTKSRARFLGNASPLAIVLVASSALGIVAASPAAAGVWTGGTSSNWYTPGNWTGGVPNAGTDADIDTVSPNPTVISGLSAFANALNLGKTAGGIGDLTVAGGSLTTFVSRLGDVAGSKGTITVSGAGTSWTNTTNALVGISGTGALNVLNGALATVNQVVAARLAGSTGSVTVSGPTSKLVNLDSIYIAQRGTGTLSVLDGAALTSSGAVIADTAPGVGSVLVDGANSTWANTLYMYVGNGGNGSLTVSNGGVVTSGLAIVARVPDSVGSAVIAGANSAWTMTGNLTVAEGGAGSVTISDGAKVSNALGTIGSSVFANGTVTVDGAGSMWTNSGDLYVSRFSAGSRLTITNGGAVGDNAGQIAEQAGSVGVVSVIGAGSTWTNSTVLVVGGLGTGTLSVESGGSANDTNGFIALDVASSGTAGVDGVGSTWVNSDRLNVAFKGTGALDITNGGAVFSQRASIGEFQTASGTVSVSGPGSNWVNAAELTIGAAGTGSLLISNQGTASDAVAYLGFAAGATGTAVVDGAGSTWTHSVGLAVGTQGTGSLTISNGGAVVSDISYVGYDTTAVGTALVTGAGSRWTNTQGIGIGYDGVGSLTISNGGLVNGAVGVIGFDPGSVGSVVVDGAGSTWSSTGVLVIGSMGSGTLTISNGGKVSAGGPAALAGWAGSTGVLNIGAAAGSSAAFAGTFDPATLQFGPGSGTLNFNHLETGYVFAASLSGTGAINQLAGTTILSADSSGFAGATTVAGGVLFIDGLLGGSVAVQSGGTLGGTGSALGAVTIASGGTLSAGHSPGTFNVGALTLDAGSISRFELGAPGVVGGAANDLINVSGALALGGTLDATAGSAGYYRLFNAGSISGAFDALVLHGPAGAVGTLYTNAPGAATQLNLAVLGAGQVMQFWDGADSLGNGTVDGGIGTWSSANSNWTGMPGEAGINAVWAGSVGVFQGAQGSVTVVGTQGFDTLQFNTTGYFLTGGALALNGAGTINVNTAFTTVDSAIVDGAIKTLTKVGTGTLILSGTNTYTGGTVIAAGTLQLGDGETTGSLLGNVTDNGLLTFARSDALAFSGVISGTGAVRVLAGDVALTGANTFTGGTVIESGATLRLGNGGTSGSIIGNVTDNGLLVFNRTDAVTYGGVVSGTGALRVAGGSDATLTGANSYSGLTTVAAGGILRLGSGGTTGSIAGNTAVAGTLIFNRSNDLVYGGTLSGAGAIRQAGVGKTDLTGNSAGFTGVTTVASGVLAVNGSLGGTVDVLAGGKLQGNGTIGTTSVKGVIAPGNSLGVLTVNGNLGFVAGSTYQAEITAGLADRINVSGVTTIASGAVLSVVKTDATPYVLGAHYTVLQSSGGINGTFTVNGAPALSAFIGVVATYDPTHVYIDVAKVKSFAAAGVTQNQIATGGGADTLGSGNALFNAIISLPTDAAAQAAFDQLSGEVHSSIKGQAVADSHFLRDAVIDRIATAKADGTAVWARGFGAWASTDSDGNAAAFDRDIGGIFVGVDQALSQTWHLGLVGGYSYTSFDNLARSASGSSDDYHLGVYAGAQWGEIGFRSGLAYTWHDVTSARSVAFAGFADALTADHDAGTIQVFGELGYRVAVGAGTFEPFINVAWVGLHTDRFSETGGAAALISSADDTDITFATLGVKASTQFTLGDGDASLHGMLGWRRASGDVTPLSTFSFAGGSAFTIAGVPVAEDSFVLDAGFDVNLGANSTLGVSYAGQFGSGLTDHAVHADINVRF